MELKETLNDSAVGTPLAVVLAGGKGSRLKSVTQDLVAKPAVLVNGRPFVDYILEQLGRAGLQRVILLLGHKAGTVISALREHGRSKIEYTAEIEDAPLGTAGCLLQFLHYNPGWLLVVNGDTYVDGLDIPSLLRFHRANRAFVTMALARVGEGCDYGAVELKSSSRVTGFTEKGRSGEGLVSCGIYVIQEDALRFIPEGRPFSLECDLIPLLLEREVGLYGYRFNGRFYDIGTPERLRAFSQATESGIIQSRG